MGEKTSQESDETNLIFLPPKPLYAHELSDTREDTSLLLAGTHPAMFLLDLILAQGTWSFQFSFSLLLPIALS